MQSQGDSTVAQGSEAKTPEPGLQGRRGVAAERPVVAAGYHAPKKPKANQGIVTRMRRVLSGASPNFKRHPVIQYSAAAAETRSQARKESYRARTGWRTIPCDRNQLLMILL